MKVITDSEFTEFLTKKPLYTKITATRGFEEKMGNYTHALDFKDKPFKHRCPEENSSQTFRTKLKYNDAIYGPPDIMGLFDEKTVPANFDKETKTLQITLQLFGICQSCGVKIDFLIKIESDKSWDQREEGINIILTKVGQFPPYNISPDKEVEKYLTEEDIGNYKKALTNLSISYGVGAFAYFRRVIENELKRIISDISTLDFDGSEEISKAIIDFEKDHQMAKLIDVVNNYLPKSLTELGDNPVRLLYEQLSGGIHSFSDEECLEKAESIDIVLTHVITKINEEKSKILEVRAAMKKLRNNTD